MRSQLKWLRSWGQKGNAGGSWGLTSSTRGPHASRSTCRCLRSRTPKAETSKPRISASAGENPFFPPLSAAVWSPRRGQDRSGSLEPMAGKRIASEADGGARVGSRSKRRPHRNGADTGSDFARRESELTSERCLTARFREEPFHEGVR